MNTRMIEVALGLALVFAMTSLLLTAVRELWSSAWGSRGKILMQALASFVGDDPDFANKLMQHPLLLSLSKETAGGAPRPSYMGADIVVTSLIASLVERCPGGARPPSPSEFVQALRKMADADAAGAPEATAKVPLPNATLVRGMASLVHGVENDWAGYQARLCAWYDSVTERSTGWFKRKNQVSLLIFGFMVAAIANINPILIATRLWQDAPLREAIASAAQDAARPAAPAEAAPSAPAAPAVPAAPAAPAVPAAPAAPAKAGDCDKLDDPQVRTFCTRLNDINGLKNVGLPMGWNPLVVPNVLGADCDGAAASAAANPTCGWKRAGNVALVVIGWLVTAVAVSLGAPFWFDALGKLANLRGSGPPPSAADRSGIAATPPGGTTMSQPVTAAATPPPRSP